MKFCPNPECPYRRRRREAAEFLDHATECNDCGAPLVDREDLDTAASTQVVSDWRSSLEARRPWREAEELGAVERSRDPASGARLDIISGAALIALSVLLFFLTYYAAFTMGGGQYIVALGPLVYGMIRLARGLDARKSSDDS